MATGKSAAVEAYEHAEEEMRKHQARVVEARKAAAREVGEAILATGAGKLPAAQLKAILGAVVAMGADQALAALGVKATGGNTGKANGSGGRANGAAADDGKPAGVDADVGRDPLGIAEARIAEVLDHPATGRWLRDALAAPLSRDPVDVLDDADVLHELLVDRTAAAVDRMTEGYS